MTDPVRPRDYLLSLPERLVRAIVGLGAGLTREVGDVVVPAGVRDTQLYQNLVDTTLRFLIEQVGSVDSQYKAASEPLPDDIMSLLERLEDAPAPEVPGGSKQRG